MKIKRRDFLVAGGVAFFAALGSDAGTITETFGPDSTFQTQTSPGLLPLADPTFAVNSQPSSGFPSTGLKAPYYSFNPSVVDAAVDWSTNEFIVCSIYSESGHDIRGFTSTGVPIGSHLSGIQNIGIGFQSCALDSTYLYHTDLGCVARRSIASAHFFDPTQTLYDTGEQYVQVQSGSQYTSGSVCFIGIAVTADWIYVVDPVSFLSGTVIPGASARITPVSKNWTGSASPYSATLGTSWNVPYCRQIAVDKEGMLWALQQAVAANSQAAVLSRWNPSTGTQLQSLTLPTSVYPMDIACDPNSDTVLIADNGRDQNFKKYSYDSNDVNPMAPTAGGPIPGQSTIGVQYGYLAGPTPGVLGSQRFVGPRAIAVDTNGNALLCQGGQPGAADNGWGIGTCAIVSLLNSSGVEQWRNWGGCFGGNGEPSDDGTMFYERDLAFTRSNAAIEGAQIYRGYSVGGVTDPSWLGTYSQYLPYAFTADPWTYSASEDRCQNNPPCTPASSGNSSAGTGVRVISGSNGSTYLFMMGGLADQTDFSNFCFRVYQVQTGSAIAIPRTQINTTAIYRNGSKVDTLHFDGAVEGGWWVQPNMDCWLAGIGHIYRLRFQGFDAAGTPLYDSAHVDNFPLPAEVSTRPGMVRCYGTSGGGTVYFAGYGASDPYPGVTGDNEIRFRRIVRYDGVPAKGNRWPAATWNYAPSFTVSSGIGFKPFSFCASPADNTVVIGWQQNPSLNGGPQLEFLTDDGTSLTHRSNVVMPPTVWGDSGVIDVVSGVQAKNGYVWTADDYSGKVLGKAIAGT